MSEWPQTLQINAWTDGVANRAESDIGYRSRLLATGLALRDQSMLAPKPLDERDWRDPRIGWGVLLPDAPALDDQARAKGDDAPAAIRSLLAERDGVVLRYRQDRSPGTLRRYYADGAPSQDIFLSARNFGTARGQAPRYLLIYGSPAAIPWDVQFDIHQSCLVGRLDLEGVALENYVEALRSDWSDRPSDRLASLIWAVDHDTADITHLMRNAIARPLAQVIGTDTEFAPGCRFIDGLTGSATGAALAIALAEQRPRFVATTSHGATGPLNDVGLMSADLGLLVDADHQRIKPAALGAWEPGGAVWYAHACCSAGSSARSTFEGLVRGGSDVDAILKGVAACGETMAPLPRELLSAASPLRAFIGHVEPTFDWSVRHNKTGQFLTKPLLDALYTRLFLGDPVALALDGCRRLASDLMNIAWNDAKAGISSGSTAPEDLLAIKLMATDWRAIVLIGDPTVKAF